MMETLYFLAVLLIAEVIFASVRNHSENKETKLMRYYAAGAQDIKDIISIAHEMNWKYLSDEQILLCLHRFDEKAARDHKMTESFIEAYENALKEDKDFSKKFLSDNVMINYDCFGKKIVVQSADEVFTAFPEVKE